MPDKRERGKHADLRVQTSPCKALAMSDTPQPDLRLRAKCACGAVTVEVNGQVRSMFLCSCRDCQIASGGGHSAVAMFRDSNVLITGETRAFGRPAASGATLTRLFCPLCGVGVAARTSRAEGIILLPAGLFSDSTWFRPSQVIFASGHLDWDTLPDVPQHAANRKAGAF